MTTEYIRRTTGKTKMRAIAGITMFMMVISLVSLTTLAMAEDASDSYNDFGAETVPAPDSEEGAIQEVDESESYIFGEGTDDTNIELSGEDSYNQINDSYYTDDAERAGELECYHNEPEEQCICEYEYEHEYGYAEAEVLIEFVVTDWDGLYDVFTNLMTTDGPYTVNVADSITMSAQLNISAGRTVYISGGGVLYQPTANARHFAVDGTLIMSGITLRGTGAFISHGGITVNASGELIMNAGSVIEGNRALLSGGAVFIQGTMTINAGTISGNEAHTGGGVYLSDNNATLIMNGGAISNNIGWGLGAGVFINRNGIFTMNDGEISGNYAQGQHGGGGGIYNVGFFIMNGGTIYGNRGEFGGGVQNARLSDLVGSFVMNGGTISGNSAWVSGGGVQTNGVFAMYDGEVSGNDAVYGGGVGNGGTFTMRGGHINGNDARYGGGVGNGGTFTMRGGFITSNTATTGDGGGGGVFSFAHEDYPNPLTPTAFSNIIFENGTISGNAAGTGRYALPINYYERAFGHLLNNYDINFRGSHRVEAITFDLNGGNVSGDTDDIEVMVAYEVQVGISNIPIPELFGYSFTGWLLENELLTSTELAERIVDAPMTFVAQWEELTQTTPNPQYRTIRIYYYLEGYGHLVNDTANDAIGREYVCEVGSTFNLAHVVDRNELISNNDYVFEGWRVYVDGLRDDTYIASINLAQLRGSFIVPASPSDEVALISIVAVWSTYGAQDGGDGNDGSSNDSDTATSGSMSGSQQKRLPQTGLESSILLWSALLVQIMLVGIGAIAKIRTLKVR